MSPPRRVLPGATYLVTRRYSERRFFLRPSEVTSEIFLHVFAIIPAGTHLMRVLYGAQCAGAA